MSQPPRMPGDSLRDRILSLARSKYYQPKTKSELAEALDLSTDERAELRQALDALTAEGRLVLGGGSHYEARSGDAVGKSASSRRRRPSGPREPDEEAELALEAAAPPARRSKTEKKSDASTRSRRSPKPAVEPARRAPQPQPAAEPAAPANSTPPPRTRETAVRDENSAAPVKPAKPAGGAGAGDLLLGVIKFHPKGHAFFFPDLADPDNQASSVDLTVHSRIPVQRRDADTALDGDRVLVRVTFPAAKRDPRRGFPSSGDGREPSGSVEKILSRRSGRIVGQYHRKGKHAWIETDDAALETGRVEIRGDTTAEPGQLVVVEVEHWSDRERAPLGSVIEVLGWPGDAGTDILSIIHRFGLRTSFPDEVLAEADAVPEEVPKTEIRRRKDWRKKLVITIDPADAKDHDDAIWVAKAKGGGWQVAVHIADVSHYVKPGTHMDREAVERGNSTYLVDRVLPMLPTVLSNGICSLKPDVDRLTKCALLDISKTGEVKKAVFIDAVIHSRAKISYEQAQVILDGGRAPEGSDPKLEEMVREAWKMATVLRRRRFDHGALDLEMPEIKVRLDEQGRASSADPVVHTESHQLVEECMLAANESVARALNFRGKPAIHRIHEDPDPSRLADYTATARLHGYKPGDLTNRAHIQKLLDESKGSPEEHAIKLGLLKSLKRAAYSAEPLGHYGLAKTDYCHFTSPIRRYADLVVHRALQPLLENPPKKPDHPPSQAEMRELSRHISDTERTSSDAESESKQLKMMEFLQRATELEEPPVFDGLVTDVRPMGLMVEIPHMGVRGVVKREDLPSGARWRFESHRMAWTSYDGRSIALGMRLPLRVSGVNMERRFVDFVVAGRPTSEGSHQPQPRPVHKKHRKPMPKPAAKAGPPPKPKRGARKRGHKRR